MEKGTEGEKWHKGKLSRVEVRKVRNGRVGKRLIKQT